MAARGSKTKETDGPAGLVVALVAIDSVTSDPANAREHNDRSIDTLVASLRKFGQRKPIVVDTSGVIRAGNGTWLAAKRLGWTQINATVTDLSAEDMRQYAIADNRAGELSFFDERVLADQLQGLTDADLHAIGFDEAEAHGIFDAVSAPDRQPDAAARALGARASDVCVKIMVSVRDVDVVERALRATGQMNRGDAMMEVCRRYLQVETQAESDAGR